jgi:hypothetical protein
MGYDTEWRQTGRFLWVGSRHDRHVGIIEHGHGFIAIDNDGEVRGRFKTLTLAQEALEQGLVTEAHRRGA